MAIKQLNRDAWTGYFDAFSKKLGREHHPEHTTIRVLSLEDGVQVETTKVPLTGITFDPKSNLLEILTKNLDHLVYDPVDIYVDETEDGRLACFEVIRKDGTKEVVELE